MMQSQPGVPAGDPSQATPVRERSAAEPFSGWLALADPDGQVDLRRLFPEIDIRIEWTSAGFADALATIEPSLVVLIAPPAGLADIQRLAAWRAEHDESCAVLLSPHHAVAVRLQALDMGFDDAVDTASDPMELVGRLSIAGRRTPYATHVAGDRIVLGDGIELDLRARAIRRDGRLLSMRPRELALLEFLASHPGRAFSREELLRHVWRGVAGNERMVDVYVFWLRSKIEPDPANPVRLLTVRGSGYLFEPPSGAGSSTPAAAER
jgi:DNA-binding response OmpR family regulator